MVQKMAEDLSKQILDKFSNDILPPLKNELLELQKLPQRGISAFPVVANALLGRAIAGLLLVSGKTSIEEVNEIEPNLSLSAIFFDHSRS